jgi:hypothetical protein
LLGSLFCFSLHGVGGYLAFLDQNWCPSHTPSTLSIRRQLPIPRLYRRNIQSKRVAQETQNPTAISLPPANCAALGSRGRICLQGQLPALASCHRVSEASASSSCLQSCSSHLELPAQVRLCSKKRYVAWYRSRSPYSCRLWTTSWKCRGFATIDMSRFSVGATTVHC